MSKIRIITDSASDIPVDLQEKYDVDVIPFTVVLGDKEYVCRQDFDSEGFYRLMEKYPNEIPKTSQITAFRFMEIYYNYFLEGYTDLIMILINGEGSATYGNSLMAIDMLYEEHPECEDKIHIYSYDSKSYCCGYGHTALKAGQMLQEGSSAVRIRAYIEEEISRRRVYFAIYQLQYAGRSGRIPSAAAFLGDKIGIKPIMRIWDHEISTAVKCRGEKKVVAKIARMVLSEMEPGGEYQIVYGSDSAIRDEMRDYMIDKLGYGPTEEYQIGSEVAANAGSKVVGVSFNMKEGKKK